MSICKSARGLAISIAISQVTIWMVTNIGISDQQQWTSDSYRTYWNISDKKWEIVPLLYVFLHKFVAVLTIFWQVPRKLMSCWRPYCAVGVPADASTVLEQSLLFYGILFVAVSLLLLTNVMFLLSLLLLNVLVVCSCYCCWCPCWKLLSSLPMGARNRVGIGLSYLPARLHRRAQLIGLESILDSLKV